MQWEGVTFGAEFVGFRSEEVEVTLFCTSHSVTSKERRRQRVVPYFQNKWKSFFNIRHSRWLIDHKYIFYLVLQSDLASRLTHVLLATSFGSYFSPKSPDCLPDGSGGHIRIDRNSSAVSWPVTNCHERARLSNLEKRRQEEARAHTGLLSHGYYYYYYYYYSFGS
jgi:hypothetical protein